MEKFLGIEKDSKVFINHPVILTRSSNNSCCQATRVNDIAKIMPFHHVTHPAIPVFFLSMWK